MMKSNIEKIFNDELKRHICLHESMGDEHNTSEKMATMIEEYSLCYNVNLVRGADNPRCLYDVVCSMLSKTRFSHRIAIHTRRVLIMYRDNT